MKRLATLFKRLKLEAPGSARGATQGRAPLQENEPGRGSKKAQRCVYVAFSVVVVVYMYCIRIYIYIMCLYGYIYTYIYIHVYTYIYIWADLLAKPLDLTFGRSCARARSKACSAGLWLMEGPGPRLTPNGRPCTLLLGGRVVGTVEVEVRPN